MMIYWAIVRCQLRITPTYELLTKRSDLLVTESCDSTTTRIRRPWLVGFTSKLIVGHYVFGMGFWLFERLIELE